MALEKQDPQRMLGGAVIRQFAKPLGQRGRHHGGVIYDDERGLLPAPCAEIFLGNKPGGLKRLEKTALPSLWQLLKKFERQPRFA